MLIIMTVSRWNLTSNSNTSVGLSLDKLQTLVIVQVQVQVGLPKVKLGNNEKAGHLDNDICLY